MDVLAKVSICALIFLAVLIIILVVFLQVLLTYAGYGLIKEFPDSDQTFVDERAYHVTDRKLTNMIRDKIIIPDDELWYSFKVNNLKNFTTNINYELEFFKGGIREGTPYTGTDQLKPLSSDPQNIKKIYLKTSGPYDVKLNLLFYNNTDEKYTQYSPEFDHIEVTSKSDQLQISQNDYLFWGLIASFVIGVGTTIALIFSVHYSKKEVDKFAEQNSFSKEQITLLKDQNDELKIQFSIQNRPWVSIADVEPRYELNKKFIAIFIKNYGNSPALNILTKGFVDDVEVLSDFLDKIPMSSDSHSLAPQEIITLRIPITDTQYKIGHGSGNNLYFGLILNYEFEKTKLGKFTLYGYINEGSSYNMTQTKKILEWHTFRYNKFPTNHNSLYF